MKQELVEKVMRQMSDLENKADPFDNPYRALARYALALAERAAREAVRLTGKADYRGDRIYSTAEILGAAVDRAVEEGA